MTLVVVNQGEEQMLDLVLAVNYTLKLYTNDVTAGLTQDQIDALTEASFTAATFTGYADKALTGGSWTTSQENPSTGTYAQQTFTSTADQTEQLVYGYYVTRTLDGALVWFEEFDGPLSIAFNGDSIAVTPTITLDDDKEATVTARGVAASSIYTNSETAVAAGAATATTLTATFDSSRLYRVHLHSSYNKGAAASGLRIELWQDGSNINRLHLDTDTDSTDHMVSSSVLYEPTTGAHTLTVYNGSASSTTLALTANATVPRQFWVEDIGPRP